MYTGGLIVTVRDVQNNILNFTLYAKWPLLSPAD